MAYRIYEDDPVYKVDERLFETYPEVVITARMISQLTGHNTVIYTVVGREPVDFEKRPVCLFYNGKMFIPAMVEPYTEAPTAQPDDTATKAS